MSRFNYKNFYNHHVEIFEKYSFVNSFNVEKRANLNKSIDDVVKCISKHKLSEPQVAELKDLRLKLIDKYKGNVLSNLFIKIFYPREQFKYSELLSREKKIDKLLNIGIIPQDLPKIIGHSNQAKRLDNLLFDDHIFECMKYYGHPPTFNKKGEMTFMYKERALLTDMDVNCKQLKSLHKKWKEEGLYLEVRGDYDDGCYRTYPVQDLSLKEFKALVMEEGALKDNINIVYPTKFLTLKQLKQKKVVNKDGDLKRDRFTYSEMGFVKHTDDWGMLPPSDRTKQPPENFTLELLVHTKGKRPVLFKDGNFGHASIKLTTPNGEIYSLGFWPSEYVDLFTKQGTGLQSGDMLSPDQAIFYSSSSYTHNTLTYTLPDAKSFHQLMHWIAGVKGTGKGEMSNLYYHFTHHSCATFAKACRDKALELGAKAEIWNNHTISDWTHTGFKLSKTIFKHIVDTLLKSPIGMLVGWHKGVEVEQIKNFNIRHLNPGMMDLTADLIVEHKSIYNNSLPRIRKIGHEPLQFEYPVTD